MKILVVDDSRCIVDDIIDELSTIIPDSECIGTSDPFSAVELFKEHIFDVVITDIEMPGYSGIDLAKKVLEIKPKTNIIYITGYNKYALEAHKTYASAFIEKPITTETLTDAFNHLRFPVSSVSTETINSLNSGKNLIGVRILKYREERGLTRQQFAAELNISPQTVYRWENGERTPDIVTILSISKVLGINPEQLLL